MISRISLKLIGEAYMGIGNGIDEKKAGHSFITAEANGILRIIILFCLYVLNYSIVKKEV